MKTPKRVALITGVSRREGLGFGIAQALKQENFDVIITARQLEKVAALVDELSDANSKVIAQPLDVTDEESVKALAEYVERAYQRLDVLINNASARLDFGVQPLETDFATTQAALDTNLLGAWRMIQHFYPLLKQSNHPRVVNISSGAGSFGDAQFGLGAHPALVTSYGISKLALNGLTVKMARQLKEDGILINSVDPGLTATAPGMEEMGARPVSESVGGIVWAATLPDDGPNGGFFRDQEPMPW